MPVTHTSFDSPLLRLPNTYRAFYGSFSHLHPIQKQAVEPVLAGRDLVLQSATGSGKTEAVLAPCVERTIRSGGEDGIVYIVPTRALEIDLDRRLSPVFERLGLSLGIRTGDVKRTGGGRPDLVLTTPESLDVLMGSSNAELQHFVRRIRTVIIDEVHPLLHQYRGGQLALLLQRLERRIGIGGPVQRIALSATIADAGAIVAFFGFRPDAVRLISAVQREIVPHLIHLKNEEAELVALLDDLHDAWKYRKILMFANSRGQCDRLFAVLSRQGRFRGVAELHYSNLKPRERRGIEERFRRRDRSLCIATSTLELGIDIGDVDAVLLFEPPDSVSAFLQRVGRSNRRQAGTQFWGICRGERPGEQLLRFLGLLQMAGRGEVEAPLPNSFPSVMVQQILSCVYEKKRISLRAMQALFPDRAETLELLFASLEKQGWLRRERGTHSGVSTASPASPASAASAAPPASATGFPRPSKAGLFRGGYRYRDSFLDRRIWSNFPETEEDYVLELEGEAVADLPRSIVRQLEPGDRVHLAGKRIQVLQIIDAGERKRVLARHPERPDDDEEKEIMWLGAGFKVSFEVAQSVREILKSDKAATAGDAAALGLFARTRRLLDEELGKNRRVAVLANSVEVMREPTGFYRYRTFLGSVGNLILRYTVDHNLGAMEDFHVTSDEIGITCSHPIRFEDLSLPLTRDSLKRWVRAHLRALRALFPLNSFCDALPTGLLVEELTGFLFDPRIMEAFSLYVNRSSEIVSGDPACLDIPLDESSGRAPVFLHAAVSTPLQILEKERWSIEGDGADRAFVIHPEANHFPRALTGTLIGEFIRHEQCERWLSFHFLPPGRRPRRRARQDPDLDEARTQRGRRHERRVLDHIGHSGGALAAIQETDSRGSPISLKDRIEETSRQLELLIMKARPERILHLSRAVLTVSSVLAKHFLPEMYISFNRGSGSGSEDFSLPHRVDGIGIPDLIRVTILSGRLILEVGDIKDSLAPYYSQKWQVAFHAWLLREWIDSRRLPLPCEVGDSGFLITPPVRSGTEPVRHSFPLAPYMAAFPALFQNIGEILLRPPSEAAFRLQAHCTTCPCFEICYRQALHEEDIQFLPWLTAGTLEKMRRLGLSTIEDAGKWLEKKE